MLITLFILFIAFQLQAAQDLNIDLTYASIREIQNSVLSGVKCEQIIQSFLQRIDDFDQQGSSIHAIIIKNPLALNDARNLDAAYSINGLLKGPLHCVPALIKDIIVVKNLSTTLGVNMFSPAVASADAYVVQMIKQQGAIVVGKANLDPFAMTGIMQGSQVGGIVHNPYGTSYTTYGSSTGNAAGQAARYAVIGLGSDTTGSTIGPASATNLIGFRPSMDLYSFEGIWPGIIYEDTIGQFAFNVEDIGILTDVLTNQSRPYYSAFDMNETVSLKIGILSQLTWQNFSLSGTNNTYTIDAEATKLVKLTIARLQTLGATISNVTEDIMEQLETFQQKQYAIGFCYPEWVDSFLSKYPMQSTAGLIQNFNEMVAANLLPAPYQAIFEPAVNKSSQCPGGNATFFAARQVLQTFFSGLYSQVDLLAFPAYGGFPQRLDQEARMHETSGVGLPGCLGYPAISLPMGFSSPRPDAPQGLPLGLILMSEPGRVKSLLNAAFAFDSRYSRPVLPTMQTTSSSSSWYNSTDGLLLVILLLIASVASMT